MDIGQILQNNNPINNFAQGFQIGSVMRQQSALNKQRELEVLKQTQIENRAKELQSDITLLTQTTDPYERMQGLNNVMLKYPEMADKFKSQATFYGDEVKNNAINQLLPALNALNLGNKDVATQRLQTAAEAFKNSGNTRGAQALEAYISDIASAQDVGPLVQTGYMTLASILGPDKLMETLSKSQEYAKNQATMPSEISKVASSAAIEAEKAKQAPLDTQIKQIQAKFEETKQAQELEQRGWNINKLKNDIDISKQNARIAAMNAQIAKEGNELKRNELLLKAQDAQTKRDDLVQKKITDVEAARTNMDNMLNTAQRIINTPINIIESATGPISTRLPTLKQDTADFESLVETLGSQAFLAQIPNIKGMGALSNAEGEKLQQALQNFSLKQSPKQLIGNIKEAQRIVMKARKNVADQYGVPENAPDIPAKPNVVKVTRIK